MSQQTRARSREKAAFLKAHNIQRTTGACPWGCGTPIRNGGKHLLEHLSRCQGKRRAITRQR